MHLHDELASIIIVTYNHGKYIERCIGSIDNQKYPHEIIVVDNGSTDDTLKTITLKFPHVRLIKTSRNYGYGLGNNIGVHKANGKYIVILNPDTIVNEAWLEELIKPLKNQVKLITTPKILTYDGKAINTCGNINHFTGLTFTRGFGSNTKLFSHPEIVTGFSGCCFALKKSDFLDLGGFDKRIFMYNDDSELSWRANLRDFKILFIPTSIVMHDYQLEVPPKKIYYLEVGRYIILRKYFSKKRMFLLLPSLLVAELLIFGYSCKLGLNGLKFKIRAISDSFLPDISVLPDEQCLLKKLSVELPVDQLTFSKADKIVKIIANYIFKINYQFTV